MFEPNVNIAGIDCGYTGAGLKTIVFAQTRIMVEVLTKYLKDTFDPDAVFLDDIVDRYIAEAQAVN